MRERAVTLAVVALLAAAGIWLAVAAAGGRTAANAGRVQFYPGPVCHFAPHGANGEGCPRRPRRRAGATVAAAQPQRR